MSARSLETERLRLRQFTEGDLDAYAPMVADREVMRYIGTGAVMSRMEAWRSIAGILGHWQMRGYGMWALELKATGELVGRAGFLNPEGWPGFEVGWMLARAHWGRGYAIEAGRRALAHAFDDMGRDRVISLIRPGNARSIRVAEALGERLAGEVRLMRARALVYEIVRAA